MGAAAGHTCTPGVGGEKSSPAGGGVVAVRGRARLTCWPQLGEPCSPWERETMPEHASGPPRQQRRAQAAGLAANLGLREWWDGPALRHPLGEARQAPEIPVAELLELLLLLWRQPAPTIANLALADHGPLLLLHDGAGVVLGGDVVLEDALVLLHPAQGHFLLDQRPRALGNCHVAESCDLPQAAPDVRLQIVVVEQQHVGVVAVGPPRRAVAEVEVGLLLGEELEVGIPVGEGWREAAPHLLELVVVGCEERVERGHHVRAFPHADDILHSGPLPDRHDRVSLDCLLPRFARLPGPVVRLEDVELVGGVRHPVQPKQVIHLLLLGLARIAVTLWPGHRVRVHLEEIVGVAQGPDLVHDVHQPGGPRLGAHAADNIAVLQPLGEMLVLPHPGHEVGRHLAPCNRVEDEAGGLLQPEEGRRAADLHQHHRENDRPQQGHRHQKHCQPQRHHETPTVAALRAPLAHSGRARARAGVGSWG
mmetsp:Transcript_108079/g.306472  ORF Transcript_108079/g.306472 Transcript_108079/m.306472 type:complete len:479 (-) Transcript_108079:12-1448(-)